MQLGLAMARLNSLQNLSDVTLDNSSHGMMPPATPCPPRRSTLTDNAAEVLEMLQDGKDVTEIARIYQVTASYLRRWIMQDEIRRAAWLQARAAAADTMIRETLQIADNTLLPPEDRRIKVQTRQWTASRLDRETWGEQQKAAVEVSIDILGVLRAVKQQIIDITP